MASSGKRKKDELGEPMSFTIVKKPRWVSVCESSARYGVLRRRSGQLVVLGHLFFRFGQCPAVTRQEHLDRLDGLPLTEAEAHLSTILIGIDVFHS